MNIPEDKVKKAFAIFSGDYPYNKAPLFYSCFKLIKSCGNEFNCEAEADVFFLTGILYTLMIVVAEQNSSASIDEPQKNS